MFNDFRGFSAKGEKVHIAAPPTLLISALGIIDDVAKAVTLDFKQAGDALYLVGETKDELGASEYFAYLSDAIGKKCTGKNVPRTVAHRNAKNYAALSLAVSRGLVSSALAVGRGGLGVALAKAAVAGQLGARIELTSKLPADSTLFSESQGRILVSVRPEAAEAFEEVLGKGATRIGEVGGSSLSIKVLKQTVRVSVSALTQAYRKPFKNWI
jgi:phosphoribosylformylglycinamidine synthase